MGGGTCGEGCLATAGDASRAGWEGAWGKGAAGSWNGFGQVDSVGRNNPGIVVVSTLLDATPLLNNLGKDLAAIHLHSDVGNGQGAEVSQSKRTRVRRVKEEVPNWELGVADSIPR